ncbi:putative bifunctional diguanylate cyclase/phosphodiesterase [Amycolatopsis taiwanensis]|uniref:putative bifunctional diguanylate cyclase/phosphodiesterase n=1 Tax=Amycolatopsis taiwanensis TaxID=342230 RepID=UPI002556301F|nr:EAL domain-containing protein [Amycolatopsis taiwanensis]
MLVRLVELTRRTGLGLDPPLAETYRRLVQLAALQAVLCDITAQQATEAALRYQAAVVSHVSDAVIATDQECVVTSWNPAAETVYGHPAADALGRPVAELLGAPLDITEVVRGGGVSRAMHRRADGSRAAVRVSVAEMDGGYVLVCTDETAQRRAERYFATVIASLEEGVLVTRPDGVIESANPAALRILRLPADEVVGAAPPLTDLFDEYGRRIAHHDYPLAATRRTGIPQNGRRLRVRRADGSDAWLSLNCRPLFPDADPPHAVVMSFSDTTERRSIAERLRYKATHDALTGLANRSVVASSVTEALRSPDRTLPVALLFIDLDKFKVINDSLGHAIGDEVLQVVGRRLRGGVRAGDLVGRLGGDEFVVVSRGMTDARAARALATHLRSSLVEPITLDGRELHIDASIGIVLAPPGDPRSADDLIRDADVAMYHAKTTGRGRYEFFDVALRERMQRRLRLEQDLREAVRRNELWVAYQPVVALPGGRTVSVEALLRWNQPNLGVVSPVEFIPLAEESDLISSIGIQTLLTVTREMARQRKLHGVDMDVAVNLSARQLDDPDLLLTVEHALRGAGLPAPALCLEVTESALMRDPLLAAKKLDSLRGLGVRIAIDDFGTGYASLSQLLRLPVDILKIDQSFVTGLGESGQASGIVSGIVAMAHAVDLTVIAEGVETKRQRDVLSELGCDQAQGHYFGRPGSSVDIFRRDDDGFETPDG